MVVEETVYELRHAKERLIAAMIEYPCELLKNAVSANAVGVGCL